MNARPLPPPAPSVCPLCGAAAPDAASRCESCGMSLAGVGNRPGPFSSNVIWWWAGGLFLIYLVVLVIVAVIPA
jgi:hypothetical protein